MRNIFLLLLLSISIGQAQNDFTQGPSAAAENASHQPENKLLDIKDFKLTDGRMLVSEMQCRVENGFGINDVLVSVVCKQKAFNETGVDKINQMILFANKKIRGTINLEHKYIPAEIKMAYNPESQDWGLTNLYSVEDANGAVKSSLLSLDFDSNGNFIGMKRVF